MRRLVSDRALVTARTGLDLEVRRVVLRDLSRERSFTLPDGAVTTEVMDLVTALEAFDVVAEIASVIRVEGT